MKLAILYAGQGSQHPGMGKDLYEAYPAFRAAFDAAALDFDLHSVCFEDPDGVLNQTEYTQPCMVAFAAGVTAVLQENGVKADDLAGLSLGEYSALPSQNAAKRLPHWVLFKSAITTARASWSSAARKPLWKRLPSWQKPPVPAAASPSRSAARSTPG